MRVLLLHGFTSSLETVTGLVPRLQKQNFEYSVPVLRGHCTRPEDLLGVTWRDWLEDARQALLDLTREGHSAAVVGLSMGGLVALNLAAEHPTRVSGVATVAACMRFRSPLFKLMPVLKRLMTYWSGDPDYADPELAALANNYSYFPIETLASLESYQAVVEPLLGYIQAPACLIAASQDPVVSEQAIDVIAAGLASEHKEVHWFHRSHHEMMRDVEREEVFDCLMQFLNRLRSGELEVHGQHRLRAL
ncbi:MAG: alpha/beta hydrolase [Vulcanimicrobiota bacterium]